MGGDFAPAEAVAGAVDASRRDVEVVLVGETEALERELANHDARLEIVEAPEVIGMGDDPTKALREKPGASVVVAARLVAEGSASGFVSAGSTGASLAAAVIVIGRTKGVSRPAIASIIPTPGSPTLLVDAGANPDVKPVHLVQFAVMGSVATSVLLGTDAPRVGLLSNGEEKGKGRDLEKATYGLLESTSINFIGNVEGRDVATDKVDVIVTDGFTGNVLVKTMEGTAEVVAQYTAEEVAKLDPKVQEVVAPALKKVEQRLDYETYGGAQLLGVKGVVVIAHGSSTRTSIANALEVARDSADRDLPGRLAAQISAR